MPNGNSMKPVTQFISCDWGTSRLRLRLVELPTCRILTEHVTDEGIQQLAQCHPASEGRSDYLGAVLERGIAALDIAKATDLPVVISGMASSTLGWQSLPYAELPAPIDGGTFHFVDFFHGGRRVRLVSGLRAASDVMRGDRIVDFTTFPTGELYGLLCRNSTLVAPGDAAFDDDAFVAGVRASRSRGLSAALFQTRARAVLGQLDPQHSRAFLSGVLIGAEVACSAEVPSARIVLAAGEQLTREYAMAFDELMPGVAVVRIPPADLADATARGHARLLALP